VTLRDHCPAIILGSRFERWQFSNLAYSADVSTLEAKDHDLFLKKGPEMRSGQISLERLRRDELDLPKISAVCMWAIDSNPNSDETNEK
jgi:hypothetical protein